MIDAIRPLPPVGPTLLQDALLAIKAKRSGEADSGMAVAKFFDRLEHETGISYEILFILRREGLLP